MRSLIESLPPLIAKKPPRERNAAPLEVILNRTWGRGNIPYSLSVEVNEPEVEELGIKRCRSFRADFIHKLRIIHKAYGNQFRAARALGTTIPTFRAWSYCRRWPKKHQSLLKIDQIYEFSIEKLRVAYVQEQARKAKHKPNK